MSVGKTLLVVGLSILAVWLGFKILFGVLGALLGLVVPVAIVAGAVYLIVKLTDKGRSLPGSGRSLP